uniref:Uncharacterized protein n=1 Tax=Pseudomonas putida TaxID=303 RepID=A0A7M1HXT0_PSEPU|nr:Hypothetical protein [Pseudomonas putida]WJN66794.1 hypothetical protein [Pseudomonas putida]
MRSANPPPNSSIKGDGVRPCTGTIQVAGEGYLVERMVRSVMTQMPPMT